MNIRLSIPSPLLLAVGWLMLIGCAEGDMAKTKASSPILISVSANGSVQPIVTAGWPVVVEVMLILKPGAGTSLTLANPAGPWSDALKLQCIGPGGTDRASLFSPVYASKKSIELTHARSGLMVWILNAVEPGSLPEGSYQIRAVLDEKKLGGTLVAGLVSSPVVMTVAASPAVPSFGEAQAKCVAVMTAFTWKGDSGQALAAARTQLATYPKDVAVLFMQGKILRSQGKKTEALASFESALMAAEENTDPMAENFAIQRVVEELRRELAPPPPPIKTKPAPVKPATTVSIPVVTPEDVDFSADPRGQWAATAEASSEYSAQRYSAHQAAGAPDVATYGDHPEAWTSKLPNGGEEWLKLHFSKPVRASAVRVRQTWIPGAVVKVEAFSLDGQSAVVWSGRDTTPYAKNQVAWFGVTFTPPPFAVQTIKLTLDSATTKGWKEIDAVQLIGDP